MAHLVARHWPLLLLGSSGSLEGGGNLKNDTTLTPPLIFPPKFFRFVRPPKTLEDTSALPTNQSGLPGYDCGGC